MIAPDLSAGLCLDGRAGLDPEAWVSDDAGLRKLALKTCARCPVRSACHRWAESLPLPLRYGVVLGGVPYDSHGQNPFTQRVPPAGSPAERATAELLRDPGRSNYVIGRAVRVSDMTVHRIRHELELTGEIPVYRAAAGGRQPADAKPPRPAGGWQDAAAIVGLPARVVAAVHSSGRSSGGRWPVTVTLTLYGPVTPAAASTPAASCTTSYR